MQISLTAYEQYSFTTQPATRRLWRVKHLFEIGAVPEDDQYSGVPEVLFLPPGQWSDMTEAWQKFCLHINGLPTSPPYSADAERVSRVILSPTAFLCDFHGGRNYITGEDMDQPLPKAKCLTCRGNVVSGTEGALPSGIRVLWVDILDATKPPDFSITRETHPWLVPEATNIVWDTLRVNPFPTLGGRNTGRGLRFPLMGNPALRPYILMSDLEPLPLGAAVPSPYVPPM